MNKTKSAQHASSQAIDFDAIYDRKSFGSAKWANQWDEFSPKAEGEGLLSLWTADMDFRAPEPVVARLREAVEHGIYGYTIRDADHYRIVQSWFARRHNWTPTLESLEPAPSIMSAVATILRNFTQPGDGVIVQTPVYSPYFEVIRGNDRLLLTNQLRMGSDGQYELDIEGFEQKAKDGARVFLLCNPHNPAGKAWSHDELAAMHAICQKYDILVVSDDIHCDIRLNGKPHLPFANLNEDAANRSFICTAPTKTFNLAGVPSAIIAINNPSHREKFHAAMHASFLLNANFFGRLALETAYTEGDVWLDQVTDYLRDNTDLVETFCRENLPGIIPMRPDASFLIWLDGRKLAGRVNNIQKFFVKHAGVNLYDGMVYGPGGEGFIRINVGCPHPLLETALGRMKNAMKNL